MDEGAPVTVLFTDVEGSTDLRTRRGDDAAHGILRAHEGLVRGRDAEHGGREIKALGDGFMIAFTSARKALSCAIAIQQTTEAHRLATPEEAVRVRIGVNTGEVVPARIIAGAFVVGGSSQGQAVVEIVEVSADGVVHVRPLPGPVARNAHLLSARAS